MATEGTERSTLSDADRAAIDKMAAIVERVGRHARLRVSDEIDAALHFDIYVEQFGRLTVDEVRRVGALLNRLRNASPT